MTLKRYETGLSRLTAAFALTAAACSGRASLRPSAITAAMARAMTSLISPGRPNQQAKLAEDHPVTRNVRAGQHVRIACTICNARRMVAISNALEGKLHCLHACAAAVLQK